MTQRRKKILYRKLFIASCFSAEFIWAFCSIALGVPFVIYGLSAIAGVAVPFYFEAAQS